MNWLTPIRRVLGSFWHSHMDSDFLLGVENSHALVSRGWESRVSNYGESLIASSDKREQDPLPQTFMIRVNSIRKKYKDIFSVFAGTAGIEEAVSEDIWVGDVTTGCKLPLILSAQVGLHEMIFIRGLDFDYADGIVSFYTDPTALGLVPVCITKADGSLNIYYRLWAWEETMRSYKDRVSSLLGSKCDSNAALCWEIHQKGATVYRVKQLLASAGNAVIAAEDGAVHAVWTEQDRKYMRIGNSLYSAPVELSAHKTAGDSVSKGDTLFGYFKYYGPADSPSAEDVPGIRVMTDAGLLTASNATLSSYTVSGKKVLPLVGDTDILNAYKTLSASRSGDTRIPYTAVPSSVNPFLFIHGTVRRHTSNIALLESASLSPVVPVLDFLQKEICASAMLHVYVMAQGESVGISTAELLQTCGNMAITGSADLVLVNAWTEIERVGA